MIKPHDQVLADRMTVRIKNKTSINSVKVAYHSDGSAAKDLGFIDIYNGETIMVGWNCMMDHAELRVPRITLGIVESRMDNDLDTRRRQGLQDFSIVAWNSNGEKTIGVSANDRITKYNTMMMADGSPRQFLRHSSTGGVGWPLILAPVISVVSIASIGITIYCFKKKYGLSWKFCEETKKDDPREVVSEFVLDPESSSVQ